MNILALFATSVIAAETLLSPVPDTVLSNFGGGIPSSFLIQKEKIAKPQVTFGTIGIPQGEVLGENTVVSPVPEETPTPTIKETPTPTPTPKLTTRKKQYTIALLGDSMIDTLGPDAPHLRNALIRYYGATSFVIKNFGVGATNIDYGITRITNSYTYLGKAVPSLASQNPDIVVIESFGYNPFSFDAGALDKHWLALAKAVETVKAAIPGVKIIIGATIAPNATVFGDGAAGIAFGKDDKWRRVDTIKKYLENAVKFAQGQHIPLADAYHPSLDGSGNGKLVYINPGDHIHYSDAGRALFAEKITEAIVKNKLLE